MSVLESVSDDDIRREMEKLAEEDSTVGQIARNYLEREGSS